MERDQINTRTWVTQAERDQKNYEYTIKQTLKGMDEHPERIEKFFEFSSRFYRYNLNNSLMIYSNNPNALYCQSYAAWNHPTEGTKNQEAYRIKKNEKGIKVYVPVEVTLLKIDGELVPLEMATKEEQIQYQAGEIESVIQTRYGMKAVFDVAQTVCPIEMYQHFHRQYHKTEQEQLVKGMTEILEGMEYQIQYQNLSDFGKNWILTGSNIVLHEDLHQEEKLAAFAEIYSKAVMNMEENRKSPEVIQFQMEGLKVMTEGVLGIKRDRTGIAETYEKWKQSGQNIHLQQAYQDIYQTARKVLPHLENVLEHSASHQGQGLPVLGDTQKQIETYGGNKRKGQETKMTNQELMDLIKQQIQITDYARENGYTVVRAGRYYSLKEHDSVRIDPNRNCYWQNSVAGRTGIGKGDSIIGFAKDFVHHGNLHEALKELSGRVRGMNYQPGALSAAREEIKKYDSPQLPPRGENMHRMFAYLTKSRYVDPDIVQEFVNRKMLYQDQRGNCVFVGRDTDGKAETACLRGTLSDVHFTGDIEGSDARKGICFRNHADKVIVTESVIDSMSVMSILKEQGVDLKTYDYLSLNGVGKAEALYHLLKEEPKAEILLALDRDLGGVKAMKQISETLQNTYGIADEKISFHVPPHKKDWNEELTEKMRKFQPLKNIPFLEKAALPEIHYCAVQSTKQVEEIGFRNRDGKDQYRLVELDADGKIIPVTVTKTNTMFFSAREVMERIPNLYERISYEQLLKMQKDIQTAQWEHTVEGEQKKEQTESQGRVSKEEKPDLSRAEQILQDRKKNGVAREIPEQKGTLELLGYQVDQGVLVARIQYKGEETLEGIWKKGEELYILTGMEVNHSLEKYSFRQEEKEELQTFLKENQIEVEEKYQMLSVKEQKETQRSVEQTLEKTTQFLQSVGRKEMEKSQKIQPVNELQL